MSIPVAATELLSFLPESGLVIDLQQDITKLSCALVACAVSKGTDIAAQVLGELNQELEMRTDL